MQAAEGEARSCLHYTHECCVPKWLSFIITGQLHNHQNHQNCLNWGIFSIFKSWSIVWACVVLLTLCPTRFDANVCHNKESLQHFTSEWGAGFWKGSEKYCDCLLSSYITLSSCKSGSPASKTRCIIINNAVWSQNHTALLKIMPSVWLDRRHYLQ